MAPSVFMKTVGLVIAELHAGKTLREACDEAGVPVGTLLQRVERNASARQRLDAALRTTVAVVEDALYEAAVAKGNVTAQQFFLCNRAPERWRPNSALKPGDALPRPERVTPAELLERYAREDESEASAVHGSPPFRVA